MAYSEILRCAKKICHVCWFFFLLLLVSWCICAADTAVAVATAAKFFALIYCFFQLWMNNEIWRKKKQRKTAKWRINCLPLIYFTFLKWIASLFLSMVGVACLVCCNGAMITKSQCHRSLNVSYDTHKNVICTVLLKTSHNSQNMTEGKEEKNTKQKRISYICNETMMDNEKKNNSDHF